MALGHERPENVVVYALTSIIDGDCKATPIGKMPRFSPAAERGLKRNHEPAESSYISTSIGGTSLILFWTKGGVDAVSFLSVDEAQRYPGYTSLPADALVQLDEHLRHFPR